MYGLMVTFEPTRAIPVSGGCNEGLNFGNVAAEYKNTPDRDHDSGVDTGIKLECWRCVGEHMKKNFLKRAEEK